jgi:hypothetical protein
VSDLCENLGDLNFSPRIPSNPFNPFNQSIQSIHSINPFNQSTSINPLQSIHFNQPVPFQSIRSLPINPFHSNRSVPFQSIHPIQSTPFNPLHSTGKDMITLIRKAIADMRTERLGFTPEDRGTHSVRSAAAMAMHMASVPAYTILTIGHSINPFHQSIPSIHSINQSIQSIYSNQSSPIYPIHSIHSTPPAKT